MAEPVSAQVRQPAAARGQSLSQPKELRLAGRDLGGLLVIGVIASTVSIALFCTDPVAVLAVGTLVFTGMIISLIPMAFVGQILLDVSDPGWRSEFPAQLPDLKETTRARRAPTDKKTEVADRREQAD